jgi:hypothetical protein
MSSRTSLPGPSFVSDMRADAYGVLLSIHLTSNRPDRFASFLDRLEQATSDPAAVEVIVKIDDSDGPMNELLERESRSRRFRVAYLSTPLGGGFYDLWRSYDELLKLADPGAYFVVGLNDEMYFTQPGWDERLKQYVGLYPDRVYRLRTSIHRERNTFDYWEASCAGDLTPIITRRWLDLTGGWCPCNGPDSFQNAVAFYFGWFYRHDTFGRPLRERVVHDIEFGAHGANLTLTDPAALRRRLRGGVPAWFRLVSYPMQQEAARRAQILHAHIAAGQKQLAEYEVIDEGHSQRLSIVDRRTHRRVWQARYGISRWRIRGTNVRRKLNYPYFLGAGESFRGLGVRPLADYLLLRHEGLDRLRDQTLKAIKAMRHTVARLPSDAIRRKVAASFLDDADRCLRIGRCDEARKWNAQAQRVRASVECEWIASGVKRLAALEHALLRTDLRQTSPLLSHLRAPTPRSCAELLDLPAGAAERLRTAWLQYTLNPPFNLYALLPPLGIRSVVLFGGEGWGLAAYRQLIAAGVACAAVIDNAASTRRTAMIPVAYYSASEWIERGPRADAVLSTLRGAHDVGVLTPLQAELEGTCPVLSWKMLFALVADSQAWQGDPDGTIVAAMHSNLSQTTTGRFDAAGPSYQDA